MEPIDTVEYRGHTIKVYPDDNPGNPRDNDNLGKMVSWHRKSIQIQSWDSLNYLLWHIFHDI